MDRGTNAVPCIRGDVIPLSLGYVGALPRVCPIGRGF
jgi:hypothetical protein